MNPLDVDWDFKYAAADACTPWSNVSTYTQHIPLSPATVPSQTPRQRAKNYFSRSAHTWQDRSVSPSV